MKRSFPLRVDRLEDRCVPSADPILQTEVPPPPAPESYVIDPYLIDPSVPEAPKPPEPPADGGWIDPNQVPVPPVGDPYWP